MPRACGAPPPATERAVRALDGRARARPSATLPNAAAGGRASSAECELLAHIMLFCARGNDHFGDHYTIDNALACTNRMFRRAAASSTVVAAKRRMQHTVFRWPDISKPDELEDALYWMYHNQTEVLELACAKRKSYQKFQTSPPVNIGPAWRNIFCRPHPPAIDLCRRLRVLRLTGFSFAAPSWNGTHHMVDSPCLEELEFEFAWPRMQDHLLDSHGHQMHSKAAAFVASHAADAHAFFQFMDRFTATPSYRSALRGVLKNICLPCPRRHIALWIRVSGALSSASPARTALRKELVLPLELWG